MAAFDDVYSGSYTSTGAAKFISIPSGVDFFEVLVQGNASGNIWANAGGAFNGVNIQSYWQSGMAADTALVRQNTAVAGVANDAFVSSNGITPVTSAANLYGPAFAGTAITNANPAVMTITAANAFKTGDVVLLESTTGAVQFSGVPWMVTQTGANTYTLNDAFDASAFAAAATNVVARKVLYPYVFTPYVSYIVKMTLGASTTVVTSFPHGLAVGDSVRLVIPSPWGTTQISGQQGMVTAVADTMTFTVNINSSAASAFVFPTSAQASAGVTWPQVIPFGDQASSFNLSSTDNNFTGILLGTSVVGPSGALVLWRARHSLQVYTS